MKRMTGEKANPHNFCTKAVVEEVEEGFLNLLKRNCHRSPVVF